MPVLSENLISYYQCEDFVDSWGSNNGSAYSISIVAGLFGNCWEYSSDSDRVSVGPTPDVGTWTVAGWAALLDTGGWRAFANNNQSGTNGAYHMILNTSGEIGVWSNSTFAGSGVTLNPASYTGWHHYAATRDGAGVVRFYIDGTYVGQCSPTWTGSHRVNVIGNTIGSERFAEKIDDYAIWNRTLSAAEILDIYTEGDTNSNSLRDLIGPSTLRGMFSSVVHTVAPENARLHGAFGSIVHSVSPENARLHGMFMSVIHNDIEAGGGGGVLPPIQGQAAQGNTIQGLLNPKIQGS